MNTHTTQTQEDIQTPVKANKCSFNISLVLLGLLLTSIIAYSSYQLGRIQGMDEVDVPKQLVTRPTTNENREPEPDLPAAANDHHEMLEYTYHFNTLSIDGYTGISLEYPLLWELTVEELDAQRHQDIYYNLEVQTNGSILTVSRMPTGSAFCNFNTTDHPTNSIETVDAPQLYLNPSYQNITLDQELVTRGTMVDDDGYSIHYLCRQDGDYYTTDSSRLGTVKYTFPDQQAEDQYLETFDKIVSSITLVD